MLFPAWETFYIIVGPSGGALTGLMFVVIALVPDIGGSARQIDAFATPTVVHFSAALLLSIIVTAPWPAMPAASLALAAFGAAGTVYMLLVLGRTRSQTEYTPVFEDWLFYTTLPLAAYLAVVPAAVGLPRYTPQCLFVIGTVAVLLLLVGIHNAWDIVRYIVIRRLEGGGTRSDPDTTR